MIGSFHAWVEVVGDHMNPILVKETRQALKSRQFTITFSLLLVASLVVSFGGLAYVGPAIDYVPAGGQFFTAYFAVLAVAVFVIVPFSAYRSLASEHEERTYELMSITALRPRQIISGKLLSAAVQTLIYYSAIAPFMAFTYLLKGIDVVTIGMMIFFSMFASMAFSMLALLLSTLARRRPTQVFFSVLIIGALFMTTVGSIALIAEMMESGPILSSALSDPEFWIGMACFLSWYAGFFVLAFQLSVSVLTFEADNRSSKVRLAVEGLFLMLIGWGGALWTIAEGEEIVLLVLASFGCCGWGGVTAFLVGEPEQLSNRVQRQVPRHPFLRAVAAPFFPGPGTAFVLLLVNLIALIAIVALAITLQSLVITRTRPMLISGNPLFFSIVLSAYTVFYVGMGAVLVRTARRWRPTPVFLSAVLVAILAALGCLVPTYFAMIDRGHVYSFWQITDPIATLDELASLATITTREFVVVAPVGMAVVALLLNLEVMSLGIREFFMTGRRNAARQTARVAARAAESSFEFGDGAQPATGV